MGYTTNFHGTFRLDKPLTEAHAAYLKTFAGTRRMKRYPELLANKPDPLREAVGLPLGQDAGYFVGGAGDFGQGRTADVADSNLEPDGQPGLWCQWIPTEDRTGIRWDGGEKFYEYEAWLCYVIKHFLQPWGYVLDGRVEWQGQDRTDFGTLVVTRNIVSTTSESTHGRR